MAIGDYDVLARASRDLRAMPEPGWVAIEARVIDAVRATPRGGWPLDVVDPRPGDAAGRIAVSDLVLRAGLARALRSLPDLTLVDVAVALDEQTLRAVRIEVSGRYGADLAATAAQARTLAAAVINEVIGVEGVDIDIVVTDVHR
ncbi:hypothetical protein BST22_00065 [Mycolicibacterium chubuense]|jgi:hypothetical protein|uniref:Asp23/Gls24 family envelope stress response protein n=1 Tax=Mycolicibacterium chubuense TaxID=1800 RepID=A0A0J6VSJ5_MYCCU|nr:hypothetical protein [Mycolicibacterium chubuense]KMO72458.1 hypothetical protein MCHUDSM44219_04968 [Mycolicibacterium chubuense]ORA56384.1 hypothetical protein BST22_00065 [Mycolicibacterium chubuense]SPX99208.1 Uncharacterised protein [Mycolicibacterium chubuense]